MPTSTARIRSNPLGIVRTSSKDASHLGDLARETLQGQGEPVLPAALAAA